MLHSVYRLTLVGDFWKEFVKVQPEVIEEYEKLCNGSIHWKEVRGKSQILVILIVLKS